MSIAAGGEIAGPESSGAGAPLRAPMLVECSDCGTRQRITVTARPVDAECLRCGKALERAAGRSAGAALACISAGLILLVPGNLWPVMRSSLYGPWREARVFDGAVAFWNDGWPVMALFVAGFVVVLPLLRSAMLVGVLGSLRLGYRQAWQGRLFRYAEAMRIWSMPEVYLLAALVTYSRIAAQIEVSIEPGGWCFLAAVLLLLVGDASLDRRRVWHEIHPGLRPGQGDGRLGCDSCQLLVGSIPADGRCPRCAGRLRHRKPRAISRTLALVLAALVLAPPAFLLPMTQTVQLGSVVERNILDGISELFGRGFWYLGVIIFTASIGIPLAKLAGLLWFIFRIRYPKRRGLVLRTRTHRLIHEINRWSFTDPFIVALTAPLMTYPGIADVHAGPGALPFALVVVLTMLASQGFDSRLMWDAANGAARRPA